MSRAVIHRSALAFALAVLALVLGALVPRVAWAAPDIRAELDSDIIALGDSASVSFQASAEDVDVDGPDPGVPGAVRVDQTSVGPMHTISIINGVRSDRRGLRATWVLTPTKVGTFRITPSVVIGGKRVRARALDLRVVPPGKAPQRQNRVKRGPPTVFDPFGDPFGQDPFAQNPLQGFFDLDDPLSGARPGPTTDPNLAKVDAPRGRIAFLHSEVDKPRAVVGEQVTYSVYLYVDAEQAEPRFEDIHESGTSDFLRQAIIPEDKLPKVLGHTPIAGHLWVAKLLRKVALFPLKTGTLAITPMQVRISSGRTQGALRESEALQVEVTEPPVEGRPPGAVLGNVGKYKLTATVSPREIEAGGAVSVELVLEGTGNLPSSLSPPPRKGIEWLPPEVSSAIAPDDQGQIGGRRTFTYIVRAHEPGSIDLGEMTVPFFDPTTHRYDVARATLGAVVVKPGAARTDDAPTLILEGLPRPRLELDPRRKRGDDGPSFALRPTFWFAWLGSPVLALAFIVGARVARGWSARRAAAEDDPRRKLKSELEAIERALKSGDAKAADAAVVRYVEESVAQRVGVAIRALEQAHVARELTQAGVDAEVAAALAKVLGDAATARFAPGGASTDDARARFRTARAAVDRLGAPARRGKAITSAVVFFVAASLVASTARADETDDRFAKASHALEQGKPEIAIAELEALADRGVVDAHASFDRGLAYAERVRLGGAQPGDLGRAVHGFEEARRVTRDSALRQDADRALRVLRTEIARQRARNQAVELESLALSDSLAALLDADGWGFVACATALVLSAAWIFAHRLRAEPSSAAKRLRTGALVVAAVALPLSGTAAWLARTRISERERTFAVVIVSEARRGGAAKTPLPEGAIVEVTGREGGRTLVRWGLDTEAVSPASIRLLAHPP